MRVLVCGSRTFNDKDMLFNALYDFVEQRNLKSEPDEYGNWLPTGLTIVNGKAKGADQLSTDWAVVNWVPFEEYPADWGQYGRAAGPIRNKQMLDSGVDVVIAFLDETVRPSKGTRNMMKQAEKAGVEVIVYEIPFP